MHIYPRISGCSWSISQPYLHQIQHTMLQINYHNLSGTTQKNRVNQIHSHWKICKCVGFSFWTHPPEQNPPDALKIHISIVLNKCQCTISQTDRRNLDNMGLWGDWESKTFLVSYVMCSRMCCRVPTLQQDLTGAVDLPYLSHICIKFNTVRLKIMPTIVAARSKKDLGNRRRFRWVIGKYAGFGRGDLRRSMKRPVYLVLHILVEPQPNPAPKGFNCLSWG